jgi:hypothetical protein
MRAPDPAAIALPDWLPVPVRSYVLQIIELQLVDDISAFGNSPREILHRLTTDVRMESVWRELIKRKRPDIALVEVFDRAFSLARFPRPVLTKADRARMAAPYVSAAKLCRSMKENDIAALTNLKLGLAAALDLVISHADEWASRVQPPDSPLTVKRHGSDAEARAFVLLLGSLTRKLFGRISYRTVATIVSVALGREITWHQVREWTARAAH